LLRPGRVKLTTAITELIITPAEITTAVIMLATAAVVVGITEAVIGTANITARVIIPGIVRSSLGFHFRFPFWYQAFIRVKARRFHAIRRQALPDKITEVRNAVAAFDVREVIIDGEIDEKPNGLWLLAPAEKVIRVSYNQGTFVREPKMNEQFSCSPTVTA
jgi:hypothetical protein